MRIYAIAEAERNLNLDGANTLLNVLIAHFKLKNDAALSRALEVPPPVISKIRHRKLSIGPSLLIRMHEESGMSIRDLKFILNGQPIFEQGEGHALDHAASLMDGSAGMKCMPVRRTSSA